MDARNPIQTASDPVVLSCCFNESGSRLICGLDNGVKVFRACDCLSVVDEAPDPGRGYGIATALDDRYIVLVGGGRLPSGSPNRLSFWDNVQGRLISTTNLFEPIVRVRITTKYLLAVLQQRTVVLQFVIDGATDCVKLGSVNAIHDTGDNPYGLCCIRGDRLVLPGLTPGQVQVIGINGKTKKIIRAHASALRQLELSRDGEILATASMQGTLIRVFSMSSMTQTHEFRRGVDAAIIYSLAICPLSQFIACSSDKGTLHVFDLRPRRSDDPARQPPPPSTSALRTSSSRTSIPGGRRTGPPDNIDALSLPSHASSPRPPTQAGFYALPDDITHVSPATTPTALSALAKLPGMPRAFSDARSVTSIPYALGSEPTNWQGQPAYVTTTLPNDRKGKVANPNAPVPGQPDGRPPKGILCWDPESGGRRRLWCVGGGSNPRWEVFELPDTTDGRVKLVKKGYRKYLTRQFPEKA